MSKIIVSSGQVSSGIKLYDSMAVLKGGTALSTTVSSGGFMYISGGCGDVITVVAGGLLMVEGGGTATRINWTPCVGDVLTDDDTCLTYTSQYSGVYFGSSQQLVSHTNMMSGKTVGSCNNVYLMKNGTMHNTVVNSGGSMIVEAGAAAFNTDVNAGASMAVFSGGTALAIRENGGAVYYSDMANVTFVPNCFSGLTLQDNANIHSGTTALSATLNGCCLDVYSGGTASDTVVNSGGRVIACSGGTVKDTTVNRGGMIYASMGGTVSATTLEGGYMNVSKSSLVEETVINSGGAIILHGGTVNHTEVNSKSYIMFFLRAEANHTTINAGGCLNVASACTANHTVINSGGSLVVLTGGTISEATFCTGGYLQFNGGVASNTIIGYGASTYVGDSAGFTGSLAVCGALEISSANVAKADLLIFSLNHVDRDHYLSVNGNSLSSSLAIAVDVSATCGKYTLIQNGCSNVYGVYIVNDDQTLYLPVNRSVTVAGGKTVKLVRENSNLCLTVSVQDTTPPDLPGNIQADLVENQLMLGWEGVTDATGVAYEVEYCQDKNFQKSVLTAQTPYREISLELPGTGLWYWRVRSTDGAGNYSGWSAVSSVQIDNLAVLDDYRIYMKNCYGNVLVKSTAYSNCSGELACIRVLASGCSVTVEGGTLFCESTTNACILFGEEAYWVKEQGYGDHYNGTVTFTGQEARLTSLVGDCITAAGIVGKNLTVNFEQEADRSAGISFYAGMSVRVNYAAAILADESLSINGSFGGTSIAMIKCTSSDGGGYAAGFSAEKALTINGDLCGTLLAFASHPTLSSWGYGIKAGAQYQLTVTGTISGTVAAFGSNGAYALTGNGIVAAISGTLIAGKADADKSEDELLAMIKDPLNHEAELRSLSNGYCAIYDNGTGKTSAITVKSGAKIFGGISICGLLDVSSNTMITGTVSTTNMVINLEKISETTILQKGWTAAKTTTIKVDQAQNGTYRIANNCVANPSITIVCGQESKVWNNGKNASFTFKNGQKISISKQQSLLTVVTSGFGQQSPEWVEPVTLTGTVNSKSGGKLSWTPAVDNIKVTKYTAELVNAVTGKKVKTYTTTTNSLKLSALACSNYILKVTAMDASKNKSAVRDFNFTSTDGTAPVIKSIKAVQSADSYRVALTVKAADNVGVTRYVLSCNGISQELDAAAPVFEAGPKDAGSLKCQLTAFDAAGNSSTKNFTAKIKDVTAPWWNAEPQTDISAVTQKGGTLSWSAADDNVKVTKYSVAVVNADGITVKNFTSTKTTVNLKGIAPGVDYTCKITAADAAKNVSDMLLTGNFSVADVNNNTFKKATKLKDSEYEAVLNQADTLDFYSFSRAGTLNLALSEGTLTAVLLDAKGKSVSGDAITLNQGDTFAWNLAKYSTARYLKLELASRDARYSVLADSSL